MGVLTSPIARVRRHLGEALGLGPRVAAEFDVSEQCAHVIRSHHADEVGDHAARDGCGEPVIMAGEVARHVAAVAVARDREPLPVGKAFGHERIDRLEEVLRVGGAPCAVDTGEEGLAVPVAAARVEDEHRPASRDELLVVQVHLVGGVVPGVVRAAVDVDEKGPGTLLLGVADHPAVHLDSVADREGALGVRVALHVGEPVAVVGAHGVGAAMRDRS